MNKMIIASNNPKKIKELESILAAAGLNFELETMAAGGFVDEIIEDGDSFKANASIKADAVYQFFKKRNSDFNAYILADDSGLCVDVLDGKPGVHTARFAGKDSDYPTKFKQLWELLRPFPKESWTAHFTCHLVLITPDGQVKDFEGQWQGRIIDEIRGENGFGYDPIFYLDQFNLTSAQLLPHDKNSLSHRYLALDQLCKYLKLRTGAKN